MPHVSGQTRAEPRRPQPQSRCAPEVCEAVARGSVALRGSGRCFPGASSPARTGASSFAAPPLRRATQGHHVLSIGAAKVRPLCPPFRRPVASCATCALPLPQPNASDRHICRCLSVRPVESMSRIVGGATCRGRAGQQGTRGPVQRVLLQGPGVLASTQPGHKTTARLLIIHDYMIWFGLDCKRMIPKLCQMQEDEQPLSPSRSNAVLATTWFCLFFFHNSGLFVRIAPLRL